VSREAGKSDAAPGNEQSKLDIPRATRPQISREEVQTLLPLFLRSSESRELATALEARLQRGDLAGAKQLLDGFVEASTFAVLASDWLQDSTLVGMLQANGIRSADRPPRSDVAAERSELERSLQQERERGQALAREHAAATEKLAALEAAQERSAGMTAELSELQKALQQERERGQALARALALEKSVALEKLAGMEASSAGPERSARIAAELSELRKALQQERERGQALAREKAAALDQLAGITLVKLPDGQVPVEPDSGSTAAVAARPIEASAIMPRTAAETGSTIPENPLVDRADGLLRRGDVSGARLLLERASDEGDVRAILLLAESFDPRVLSTLGVRGMRGDLAKAKELRARARSLQSDGNPRASQR